MGDGRKRTVPVVLIETLWNVKSGSTDIKVCSYEVLIETLWNVKKADIAQIQLFGACINRNIVECKVWNCIAKNPISYSINRNIVECKDSYRD